MPCNLLRSSAYPLAPKTHAQRGVRGCLNPDTPPRQWGSTSDAALFTEHPRDNSIYYTSPRSNALTFQNARDRYDRTANQKHARVRFHILHTAHFTRVFSSSSRRSSPSTRAPLPGVIKPSTPPASGALGTAVAKLSALLLHEGFLRSGSRKAPDCSSQPTGLSCQLTGPHRNCPPDCRNHSFSLRGRANSIHFPQLSMATARHRDTQVESRVAMDGGHRGTFNLCPTTPPGHHRSM
mmetsp:Transcript_128107/g.410664  ORF Transcript_128107/g.410664 Transcript_128107/m.410664 type:complete len:237 (-) Transcript_128107:380-1090(-)